MIVIKSFKHLIDILSMGGTRAFYVKTGEKYRHVMFAEKYGDVLKIFFSGGTEKKTFDIEEIKVLKKHNIIKEIDKNNLYIETK